MDGQIKNRASMMTALWQYMVRCYERGYHPDRRRPGRPFHEDLGPFWTLCWFLHRLGVLRGAEGGYWRDAEWHWRFWDDIVIESPYRRVVIPWSNWYGATSWK